MSACRAARAGGGLALLAGLFVLVSCGLSVDGAAPVGAPDGGATLDAGRGQDAPPPPPNDAAGGGDAHPVSDGATPDAPPVDAAPPPADAPPPPDGGCSLTGCPSATGWTLVAYEGSRATSCPGGFSTFDVLENPVATASTCTCGSCTTSGAPDCLQGTITSTYDNGSGVGGGAPCTLAGSSLFANGGACVASSGRLGQDAELTAPAPSSMPTCSVQVTTNSAAVNVTQVRYCAPQATTCPGAACNPSLAPAFQTCLAMSGDAACPTGLPTKHLVGGTIDVSCGPCACTATATCHGTVTFYTNGSCGGNTVATMTADGTCTTENAAGYGSYQWSGLATVQCNAGTSAANVGPHAPTTICCP